jgi:hypothetical protein
MRYYLYKFEDNWADEMDVQGFAVLTEDEKDMAVAQIKRSYKNGGTICFGTNEDNHYNNLTEVMDCVEFEEISQSQYNTLMNLFGQSFGELGPLDIYDLDGDNDDYDEDEDDDEDEEEEFEREYEANAKKIYDFIQSEYGIETKSDPDYYAAFSWKPTPKSEIEILIGAYSGDDDEEVELTLKVNNRELRYEFFDVASICDKPGYFLRNIISQMIEKAKSYQ